MEVSLLLSKFNEKKCTSLKTSKYTLTRLEALETLTIAKPWKPNVSISSWSGSLSWKGKLNSQATQIPFRNMRQTGFLATSFEDQK